MKRKLEYGFHIFLVIMIISTLFVAIFYPNIDYGTSKTNNNSSQLETRQENFNLLNFFDVSDFNKTISRDYDVLLDGSSNDETIFDELCCA